jgi:hypothetical protein
MEDLTGWADDIVSSPAKAMAFWGTGPDERLVRRSRRDVIDLIVPSALGSDADAIDWLETIPFDVATIAGIDEDLDTPNVWFPGHFELGWGVAFRGPGHDVMMSRRWLARGPWRTIERPGDLTIVQVHPLDAPREEIEALVRIASAALYWPTGGEVSRRPDPVNGLYTAATRLFEIVVPPNAAVSTEQMNSARALRDPYKAIDPVERVAFVFIDEADARRQLDDLWVRGLEVWYVDGSGRHRVDDTYKPPPHPKPTWIGKHSQT